MKKLLTISIPTFNRAKELDNQLAWLAKEIKGFEDDCEIIISDNCSIDDTQNVIKKWQESFSKATFKLNRNSENIGWMKNFFYCVNAATSNYTWIVGDDDLIYEGTLAYVLEKLKKKPDLSLLYLNFSSRDKKTGAVMEEHWFDTDLEEKDIFDGKAIFQQCLENNIGSVIFISATVFRTELARIALYKWPASVENWAGLAYWNGYCAAHGSVLVTKENYLECTMGVSYWLKDPKAWFGIRHRDIPELYLKLQEIGYSRNFCRRNILQLLKEDLKGSELISNLKYYVWCFKDSPFWSMKVTSFFITAIGSVTFAINAPEQISETVVTNAGFNSSYQEVGKV
jgi:glycosyltransferase involved in cell wall biosynthesis